jgi:GNAT superfamily N-acetyltransferase
MSAMFRFPATAVIPADTAADFEEALPLLYAYAEWLQSVLGLPPAERQPDLRREFSDPASMYAPPRGRMLLARVGSLVRGLVCVRVDDAGAAELKRMYVAPEARGLGLGEALLRDAVDAARRLGAHRLWLETSSILMPSAFRLYEAAGFAHGPAYQFTDQPGALTMSLDLRAAQVLQRGA